ncbi:alpha/beta fold hydrolase [Undibacterium sp. RuTC16W]|uniref:alpha/beta fold hydrolase n=1 Tax=Undibacterium sp. RuTC16W TaxID=3413048 RepID=UPI003BF030A1
MSVPSFCQNKISYFAIIVAIVAAISSGSSKAADVSADATTHTSAVAKEMSAPVTPAEYQVGSMYVEQYLNPKAQGAPVILIPGLSSGAYIWDDTVKALQNKHSIYVITLAGFNGKPAMPGAKLLKAKESLAELIRTKNIQKPVLIGHSLGAALSIWFAEENSNLISGVFAVDGLPVMPRSENLTAEQRQAMSQGMKTQMSGVTQEVFADQQLKYMQVMGVIDQELAKKLAARSATSDRTAFVDYVTELFATDIRKDLPSITVPLALVSPYYEKDFASIPMSEDQKTAYYASLLSEAKNLQIISISNARHFVMLDQPAIFNDKLQSFVNSIH